MSFLRSTPIVVKSSPETPYKDDNSSGERSDSTSIETDLVRRLFSHLILLEELWLATYSMIHSWVTQFTTCWSTILSCTHDVEEIHLRLVTLRQQQVTSWHQTSHRTKKREEIGKDISSFASSTTASFSSWTESFHSSTFQREEVTMVLQKEKRHVGRFNPCSHHGEKTGLLSANVIRKKNQLVEAISPFDELQDMQDLFHQLAVISKAPEQREQYVQPRTDRFAKLNNSQEENDDDQQQQRDPSMAIESELEYEYSSYNGAHDVPTVIAIPTIASQSQDSEVTGESIWRSKDKIEENEPRSLTPHPSFEEIRPSVRDFQYLLEAGLSVDQESWPSDEDTIPKTKEKEPIQSLIRSHESMYFWEFEGQPHEGTAKTNKRRHNRSARAKNSSRGLF